MKLDQAAIDKVLERKDEFQAAGWSKDDCFGRDARAYGHHGLAWYLVPHNEIGRIFTWCCEILGRAHGGQERARNVWWRGKPFVELLWEHEYDELVPAELRPIMTRYTNRIFPNDTTIGVAI